MGLALARHTFRAQHSQGRRPLGSSIVTAASAAGSFRVDALACVVWLGGATEGVYGPGRIKGSPRLKQPNPPPRPGVMTTGLQSKAPNKKTLQFFTVHL